MRLQGSFFQDVPADAGAACNAPGDTRSYQLGLIGRLIHWREYGLHERFAGIDICIGFNPIREDDIEEGWAREVQVFGKLCKPVVMVRTL